MVRKAQQHRPLVISLSWPRVMIQTCTIRGAYPRRLPAERSPWQPATTITSHRSCNPDCTCVDVVASYDEDELFPLLQITNHCWEPMPDFARGVLVISDGNRLPIYRASAVVYPGQVRFIGAHVPDGDDDDDSHIFALAIRKCLREQRSYIQSLRPACVGHPRLRRKPLPAFWIGVSTATPTHELGICSQTRVIGLRTTQHHPLTSGPAARHTEMAGLLN